MNRPSVQHCQCGHDFDAPGDLDNLLRSRLVTGWMMVVGGLLLTIVSVLLIVFGIPIGGWTPQVAVYSRIIAISATGASLALFVKGTRIVDAAGRSLQDLQALPRARLVDRDR